jgi:hypothetical protein
MGSEPPIFEDDEEIVKFIGWFDHFLPRNPPPLPNEVRQTVASIIESMMKQPKKIKNGRKT